MNSSAVRHAVFAIATWLPPSITLNSDAEMVKPPASMSSAMCRLYLSSRIEPPSISFRSMSGMRVQLLDQQLAAPVVGAAGDRKTDSSLVCHYDLFQTLPGTWLITTVFHLAYTRRAPRCPARGSRCRNSSRRQTACAGRRRRSAPFTDTRPPLIARDELLHAMHVRGVDGAGQAEGRAVGEPHRLVEIRARDRGT